ncbi:hypothetical protein L9F63_005071, partial [Diploptera punctata]
VKQISTANDVRVINKLDAVINRMQNVEDNSKTTETDVQMESVSSMMEETHIYPKFSNTSEPWSVSIWFRDFPKESKFFKDLSEIITKNSKCNLPEIHGSFIYQMNVSVRILSYSNSNRKIDDTTIYPVVDLTNDEQDIKIAPFYTRNQEVQTDKTNLTNGDDENTEIITRNVEVQTDSNSPTNDILTENKKNHKFVQCNIKDINITEMTKKSCLKRSDNFEVPTKSNKKVRFLEPSQECDLIDIEHLREELNKCQRCITTFESGVYSVEFIEHLKEHGQHDIMCTKCNQTFTDSEQIVTHFMNCSQSNNEQSVDGTDLADPIINLKDLTEDNIADLAVCEETERKVNSLVICRFCNLAFSEPQSLYNHIPIHYPYNNEEVNND